MHCCPREPILTVQFAALVARKLAARRRGGSSLPELTDQLRVVVALGATPPRAAAATVRVRCPPRRSDPPRPAPRVFRSLRRPKAGSCGVFLEGISLAALVADEEEEEKVALLFLSSSTASAAAAATSSLQGVAGSWLSV